MAVSSCSIVNYLTISEEQHDDQMLHELLRCVKALGTSEVSFRILSTFHVLMRRQVRMPCE